jgi:predicted dehydrogenase
MLEIAVFGAGHWGPNLIRCFDGQRRSRVRWIVDPVPQRLEAASLRFPHAKVASDPEPVFADPNVHAVVVATPTVHHEALVRRALESDLHVFVEKPLTSDSRSSRAVPRAVPTILTYLPAPERPVQSLVRVVLPVTILMSVHGPLVLPETWIL